MQKQLSFYSFFTKYSLMEDYGFSSGLLRRLFRKILPEVPNKNTIEYVLFTSNNSVEEALAQINFKTIANSSIAKELDLSIKALVAKVVAFGLDNSIKEKFDYLQLDTSPFEVLFEKLNNLTNCKEDLISDFMTQLQTTQFLIVLLRKSKHQIGTNFHLTIRTRKILEYITQINKLLSLKLNINSKKHWETLFKNYIAYSKYKNSIRRFTVRHADLVALEIVEHTSNKGEKYIANSSEEYWSFFLKSLLGGSIISVFALFKIYFENYQLSPLQNALFFSCNYALCFILVKQLGGIIATKQPAVTASALAKGIDANDDLKIDSIQTITTLVKQVSRSQFISIAGNFLMALFTSCIITCLLIAAGFDTVLKTIHSNYLIDNTLPTFSLVVFASVAGFFLAFSGLISGYIDNKVVASNFSHRIRNNKLLLKSERLANFIHKKSGALTGNIFLGFCLGSAFLLSYLLPISVDIRHIAFSAANVGYAVISQPFNYNIIFLALSGVLLIGVINFIVSFSLTLLLALESRGASFRLLPQIIKSVLKDFILQPLSYFVVPKNESTKNTI